MAHRRRRVPANAGAPRAARRDQRKRWGIRNREATRSRGMHLRSNAAPVPVECSEAPCDGLSVRGHRRSPGHEAGGCGCCSRAARSTKRPAHGGSTACPRSRPNASTSNRAGERWRCWPAAGFGCSLRGTSSRRPASSPRRYRRSRPSVPWCGHECGAWRCRWCWSTGRGCRTARVRTSGPSPAVRRDRLRVAARA